MKGAVRTFQCMSQEWVWKFQTLCQVWLDGKKHGLWENPLCAAYKRRRGTQQLFTPLSSTCSHSHSLLWGIWTFFCLSTEKMALSQKSCTLLFVVVAAVCIQLFQGKLKYFMISKQTEKDTKPLMHCPIILSYSHSYSITTVIVGLHVWQNPVLLLIQA